MQVVVIAALVFAIVASGSGREYYVGGTIHGFWGDWGGAHLCPDGTHVEGFRTKSEPEQGSGDDTALNAIELWCGGSSYVSSTVGPWGRWTKVKLCPYGYVPTGLGIDLQPNQGGDDTAANKFEMVCHKLGSPSPELRFVSAEDTRDWGRDMTLVFCRVNDRLCGINTRVEPFQGKGDDTALNGVQALCCP